MHTSQSTFFASVESGLLGLVVKYATTPMTPLEQIANATFLGALIIHVFSGTVQLFFSAQLKITLLTFL